MTIVNRESGFWNRDFVVALTGYFFLFMSITLFYVFPLFLKQFGPSKSRVGLIMGAYSIMGILVRPFFGRLLDIKGRKKIFSHQRIQCKPDHQQDCGAAKKDERLIQGEAQPGVE